VLVRIESNVHRRSFAAEGGSAVQRTGTHKETPFSLIRSGSRLGGWDDSGLALLAEGGVEFALAEAEGLWGDFEEFVVFDEVEALFETEVCEWR
jgi:hypothetical protein